MKDPSFPYAARERARAAAAGVLGISVAAAGIEVLSRRLGREVYVVVGGGRRVAVKCYPDPLRTRLGGERLAAFSCSHGSLMVPECLKIDPDGMVVVMSLLPGVPLASILEGPGAARASGRVGRAVAALHAIPARLPNALERAEAIDQAAALDFGREDATRAALALKRATSSLGTTPASALVPSHGDLGPAQILSWGDRIGIVDFDKAMVAEPALDLGNLLGQLVRKRGEVGYRLFDLLLDAYRETLPRGLEAATPGLGGATPSRSEVVGYALLILLRKLVWLPSVRRAPVRSAIDFLIQREPASLGLPSSRPSGRRGEPRRPPRR